MPPIWNNLFRSHTSDILPLTNRQDVLISFWIAITACKNQHAQSFNTSLNTLIYLPFCLPRFLLYVNFFCLKGKYSKTREIKQEKRYHMPR